MTQLYLRMFDQVKESKLFDHVFGKFEYKSFQWVNKIAVVVVEYEFQKLQNTITVSYTHLDVYKRQG